MAFLVSLGSNPSSQCSHTLVSYRPFTEPLLGSCSRSPLHRVPWWLLVWLKGSPLVFLVIAIACFSAGVVLFTYSSKQVCPFALVLALTIPMCV